MKYEPELLNCLSRLRRYAQALCGTRTAGDDLLMATIRRLDLSHFSALDNLPVALFQLLNETSVDFEPQAEAPQTSNDITNPLELDEDPQARASHFDKRLEAVDFRARQAFLLVAQEGFPRCQAAAILKLGQAEFDALYSSAEDIVLSRKSTDVLIIEDDAFVSADLGRIMEGMGHSIAGIAATRQQAVSLAASNQPGLILCDISLADGSSGINAVNEILGAASVPVVFITSHPDRLSTNTARDTAYLVSKPYSVEQIRVVSSQVLFLGHTHVARYQDNAAA